MKLSVLLLAAAVMLPGAALAQHAMPAMKTFASSADVQALIAKAKAMPPKPLIAQNIVGAAPYRANLEYRALPGAPAAIHDDQDELIYMVDGTGTFTMGGTLNDAKRTNPTNQSGPGITGGMTMHAAKGDFIMVPAGTPHQMEPDAGSVVVLMSFHVPAHPAGK